MAEKVGGEGVKLKKVVGYLKNGELKSRNNAVGNNI